MHYDPWLTRTDLVRLAAKRVERYEELSSDIRIHVKDAYRQLAKLRELAESLDELLRAARARGNS
jgi:hypothetical protein